MQLPVILSPTRVELAQRCYRRHLLSDVLHARGGMASPSAAFGTQMHAAAAAWWQSERGTEGALAAYEALTPWPDAATYKYHTYELARSLTKLYTEQAQLAALDPSEGWEVALVEQRLVAPLDPGYISFQLDRLLHHPATGRYAIVDLKTAYQCDSLWESRMRSSLQQRLYRYLTARHLDVPISAVTCWIEGLDKRSQRLVYVEASADWTNTFVHEAVSAARTAVERDAEYIDACESIAEVLEHDLVDAGLSVALTSPYFNYGDCRSFNTPCEFLEICHHADVEGRAPLAKATLTFGETPWDEESRSMLPNGQ